MVVKMVVWRRWCDGVMAFVDGDDSGQKTIGVDFGIPLHAICDKWLAHNGPEACDWIELFNKFFLAMCLLFGNFVCLFVVACCLRTHQTFFILGYSYIMIILMVSPLSITTLLIMSIAILQCFNFQLCRNQQQVSKYPWMVSKVN